MSGAGGAVSAHAESPYDEPTTPLSVVGYHSIVRTRPARGCRGITRQQASHDAEWPHVADAVIEATDAPEHWPSL